MVAVVVQIITGILLGPGMIDKQIITNETFTALPLLMLMLMTVAVASTMLTMPVVSPMLMRMKEIVFRSR